MEGFLYLVGQIRLPSGRDMPPIYDELQPDEILQVLRDIPRHSLRNRYWIEWRRERMKHSPEP
jgi:hypothetical protein